MDMKATCPRCELTKDASEFHKNKRRKNGLDCYCKQCSSERKAALNFSPSCEGSKICTKCRLDKPRTEFHARKRARDGRSEVCKPCGVGLSVAWQVDNRDKFLEKELRNRHGITLDQYMVLLEGQGGVCAICREAETQLDVTGKIQRLAVDHDHSCCPTRKSCGQCIRGLLCSRCNVSIGMANDDPERLEAAASYLRSSTLPILAGVC